MRVLIIILFIISTLPALCQYRIDGIAPDSIEALHSEYDSIKLTEFKQAYLVAERIKDYWLSQSEIKKDTATFQNYFYSITEYFDVKFKLETVTRKYEEELFDIEAQMIQKLGKDHKILGYYKTKLGLFCMNALGDRERARKYLSEALSIKEKNFGLGDKECAETILYIGESYRLDSKFDKAINYLEEGIQILEKNNQTSSSLYLRGKGNISAIHYLKYDYKKAKETALDLVDNLEKSGDDNLDIKLQMNMFLSEIHAKMDEYSSSLLYSKKGVEKAKEIYGLNSTRLVSHYGSLSLAHIRLNNIDQAQKILDTAIHILKTNKIDRGLSLILANRANIESNPELRLSQQKDALTFCEIDPKCNLAQKTDILNQIGIAYLNKGNYALASNYFENSINISQSNTTRFYNSIADAHHNLSLISVFLEKELDAIDHLEKATKINQEIIPGTLRLGVGQSKLANLLLNNKQTSAAEQQMKAAVKIADSQKEVRSKKIITIYFEAAEYYQKKSEFEKAIFYGKKAEAANKQIYGDHSTVNDDIKLLLAEIDMQLGKKSSAKERLKKVLKKSGINFSNQDENEIPDHELWHTFKNFNKYLDVENKIEELNKTQIVERVNYASNLIDRLRNQYFFEVSEIEFQQQINKIFNWSIDQLYPVYLSGKDEYILSLIYQCIEKNKSINLNRTHQRNLALYNNEIPEEVIAQEKNILYQYQALYEKYQSEERSSDSLQREYVDQMIELENMKKLFLDSLKNNYPSYHQARFTFKVSSLDEAKQAAASSKQGFILFHESEDSYYRFLIGPNSLQLNKIDNADLDLLLDQFSAMVIDNNGYNNEKEFEINKNLFAQVAKDLGNVLIGNNSTEKLPLKLTIIPDGKLTTLPFEILLNEAFDSTDSYKELPYLIKSHSICYLGSVNQYIHGADFKRSHYDNTYIGFGPSYGESSQTKLSTIRGMTDLPSLKYNVDEIEKSAKLFDGKSYLHEMATEFAFEENAAGNQILHLATHAKVDPEVPLDSYLSFAIDTSEMDDGNLNAFEIAQMNLQNELVILSACETNKSSKGYGEGLVGIARAFQLASCPNIIMSNWLVDDQSASKIIYQCLQNKTAGNSTANSLRAAKLDFLENSSTINTHPSYWAAFSFYGYHTEDKKPFSSKSLLLLVFLALGLPLAWFGIKKTLS